MKKVKKMGTGGLPAGSPEKGGGVKQPPRPGMDVRDAVRNATPTPRPTPTISPTRPNMDGVRDAVRNVTTQQPVSPRANQPAPTAETMAGVRNAVRNAAAQQPAPRPSSPTMARMMKKGGKVSSASKRADGIATKGKTKGRMI